MQIGHQSKMAVKTKFDLKRNLRAKIISLLYLLVNCIGTALPSYCQANIFSPVIKGKQINTS